MKTVAQAQKNYDDVTKHNRDRISAIKSRIDAREQAGRSHADLDEELVKAEKISQTVEGLVEKSLEEAKAHEATTLQNAKIAEAKKAEQATATLKGKALAAYKKSGGKVEDFETAWPEIHKNMLESSVIQEVTEAGNRPPIIRGL